MSKLRDRLKKAMRGESAPLGFAPLSKRKAPGLLVLVKADKRTAGRARELIEAGADAVCVEVAANDNVGASVSGLNGSSPVGVALRLPDAAAAAALKEANVDFAVVGLDSSAAALAAEDIGYLLSTPLDATEDDLRSIETLNLDGILLEGLALPLTVRGLLDLRRLSGLARKPVFLKVEGVPGQEELVALRESMVGAVVVDGGVDAAVVKQLRQAIDNLPHPRRRDEDRPMATVPRAAPEADAGDEDDDD
jgi:hypothetical protein